MSTLHQADQDFSSVLQVVTEHITSRHNSISDLPILPSASAYSKALASLPRDLPTSGLGTQATTDLLVNSILPGCLQAQTGPRYFGFVTGGVTPAAQMADILAGSYDENVQVTLPDVTAATAIENRTLDLVLDLLGVRPDAFQSKTLTTGATASNVLGLGMYEATSERYRLTEHSLCKRLSLLRLATPPERLLLCPRWTALWAQYSFTANRHSRLTSPLFNHQISSTRWYRWRPKSHPKHASKS